MNLTLILFAATVLTAAALIWAWKRAVRQESLQLSRCPDCGQKVRYRGSKAGRPGVCPRCRHRWTLPATPQQLPQPTHSPEGTSDLPSYRLWRPTRLTAACLAVRGAQEDARQ